MRWADDQVRRDRQLARRAAVLVLDEQHHRDQDRDEDDDEVGAVDELLGHDDDEDDRGQDAAEPVDRGPPAPAGLLDVEPVPDHARLAEREAHEHADRVQRDQRVGVAAERPQEPERHAGQQDDAPRVGEPVAAERELARHVAVLGEDRRQPGEGVEAGVGGQEQDERGADRRTSRTAPSPNRRRSPRRAPRSTPHPAPSAAGRTGPRTGSARRTGSRAGPPSRSSCWRRSSTRAA